MGICAYCKEAKILTKEHVWPNCMLKRRKHTTAHFSVRSAKVHGADYIVKDVCGDCNNNILRTLDSYFCQLYDQYFQHKIDPNMEIEFKYDYNLLARALLKIAYNTSRQGISDTTVLSKTSSYILGKESSLNDLIILLELTNDITLKDSGGTDRIVSPLGLYRCAVIGLRPPDENKVLCRMISVGHYCFYLFLPKIEISKKEFQEIGNKALSYMKGRVCLSELGNIELKVSESEVLRTLFPQIVNNIDQYRYFFSKIETK